jgi:hypothetical protein
MAGIDMQITLQRRQAELVADKYWANKLGIEIGTKVPCHILGLFQEIEDSNCAYPVFVCEFHDGTVYETAVDVIHFTDTEPRLGMIRS